MKFSKRLELTTVCMAMSFGALGVGNALGSGELLDSEYQFTTMGKTSGKIFSVEMSASQTASDPDVYGVNICQYGLGTYAPAPEKGACVGTTTYLADSSLSFLVNTKYPAIVFGNMGKNIAAVKDLLDKKDIENLVLNSCNQNNVRVQLVDFRQKERGADWHEFSNTGAKEALSYGR